MSVYAKSLGRHLFKLKNIRGGIGISALTWWVDAFFRQGFPVKEQYFALIFFFWLLWDIKYSGVVRFLIWPSLIATILIFKGEIKGIGLLTQVTIALSYYFFLLRPGSNQKESMKKKRVIFPLLPELFIIFSFLSIGLLLAFTTSSNILFLIFITSMICGQFIWIKKAASFENKKTKYIGLFYSFFLFSLAIISYIFSITQLLIATVTSLIMFTVFTPTIKS